MRLFFILSIILLGFSACKKKKVSKAATKMQNFVIEIADYSRTFDSDFIIIPQNGAELLYIDGEEENGLNSNFISHINGYGMEELFYNGGFEKDDYRFNLLKNAGVKGLIADYLDDNSNTTNAFNYASNENWIAFPRTSDNYDYKNIPSTIYNENSDNITNLSQAKNYLYLISTNNYASKADFLSAIQATNYDAIIIDAYFDESLLTSTEINSLKTKANGAQRLVIAYMNVGAAEKYRYYWKSDWRKGKPNWLKKKYDGYEDEIWVEFWEQEWKDIIFGNNESYTKKLIDAQFDGAYLDNVEAFYFLYHRK
jgi:cysteinyl-tRNA synthetase, unknown class